MLFLVIAIAVCGAIPAVACPVETVDVGTLEVQSFVGRVLPPYDEQNLHVVVDFSLTDHERPEAERWVVPVQPNGEFILALPKGVYDFRIKVDGFLFTLVGKIAVGQSSDAPTRLIIRPPWC